MKLPLTRETLVATYELLRTTPPFSKWNLPDAEDMRFEIARDRSLYGYCRKVRGLHSIGISAATVGSTETLVRVMAHKMVHLYLRRSRVTHWDRHGVPFRKTAAEVCRIHGFDPKAF